MSDGSEFGPASGSGPQAPAEGAPSSSRNERSDTLLKEIVGHLAPEGADPIQARLDALSRFRILGQLGAGGMGIVLRAHDTVLDREVALKLLREREPVTIERFVREARAQAR